MKTNRLYKLADRIKRNSPWDNWGEDVIFTTTIDNVPYYLVVKGMYSDEVGIDAYIGGYGLDSYFNILEEDEDTSELQGLEDFYLKDCFSLDFVNKDMVTKEDVDEIRNFHLSYRGENGYPIFRRHKPLRKERFLTDGEVDLFIRILERFLMLDEDVEIPSDFIIKIGAKGEIDEVPLPEGELSYPSPVLDEKRAMLLMKRKVQSGKVIYLHTFMIPNCTKTNGRFPMSAITYDINLDKLIDENFINSWDRECTVVLDGISRYIERFGKPQGIYTDTKRGYDLLENYTRQLRIKLKLLPRKEQFDDIEYQVIESYSSDDFDF